ncbi:MAG: FkbM family methyltransferase [Verrucomicrobia bacterium]|nr:FkbM family methyltransferase [Verrucomicrobiota bacterium]
MDSYLARPGSVEPHLQRLFNRNQSLVLFDIGACEGEESIRYLRIFPRARVFAFEPLPANQAIIRANFVRYDVHGAELVPVALSDHPGEAIFHVSAGHPPELFSGEQWNYGNKSSSLLPPAQLGPMHGWIDFPEKITVTCDTLDAFCERSGISHIDFIHMDVQGGEGLVLAGGARMLSHVSAIWLEVANEELYRGQKLRPEIETLLKSHGFRLAAEELRGAEGDQLYVNVRRLQSWGLIARRWLTRIQRAARRRLTFAST